MGYTEEQSLQLATTATMFQNIADAEISAGDAALFINSQLKAFNFSADESQHVIGAVNEVANQFAVGTNDLQLALSKTASAMGGFGNSYEQTIGIITAGTEIMVGQPSKVARGWRTIGANIAKLAKETDTYSTASGKVNIAMRKQDGTMKNTYEFLTDLHKQWGNLNNEQKTAIALQLGGKNQMEVFLATMNNFDTALNATKTAMGEQNSAAKENAKYLESLAGHLANLKSAWEEFSFKMVSSDALKKGMDVLADILHFLATDAGQGIIKLALLTTGINLLAKALLGLKGLSIVKLFSGIGKGAKEAGSGLGAISKAVKGSRLASLGSTISKLASGFLGTGGLVAGIALASVALAKFVPIGERAKDIKISKNLKDASKDAEETKKKYEDLQAEWAKLAEKEREGTITDSEKNRLQVLESQTAEYKRQWQWKQKLAESLAEEKWHTVDPSKLQGDAKEKYTAAKAAGKSDKEALAVAGVNDKVALSLNNVEAASEKATVAYSKMIKAYEEHGKDSEQYQKAAQEYTKAIEEQGNSLEKLKKTREKAIEDFGSKKAAKESLGESWTDLNQTIKALEKLSGMNLNKPNKALASLGKSAKKVGIGITTTENGVKKISEINLQQFTRSMQEAGHDTESTFEVIKQLGRENPDIKVNINGQEVAISELEYVNGQIQAINENEAGVKVSTVEMNEAEQEWNGMTFEEKVAIITGDDKDAKRKYKTIQDYKDIRKLLKIHGNGQNAKAVYDRLNSLPDIERKMIIRAETQGSTGGSGSHRSGNSKVQHGRHRRESATGRRGANQPEEFSEVNERGWEFIRDAKTGQLRVAGGGKRTVTLLKKGDEVYTHAESLRMVRNDNDVIVPQFAKGKKATKAQKKKIDKLRKQFDAKLDILEYKRDRYHWSDAYFNKQYQKLYNKYKKKISKVKKGYGLGRERTQDYYLSKSEEKHDAAIDLLDARVEDIGYHYSLSKTLAKIKSLRKQRKISAEEAEEYRKQAYKANVEYNLKMFANDKKTLKQTRDAIETAYKNNKISAQEYYDYLEDLAQTQLNKEIERIEKRKELEENRYDLARAYIQQQIDLIEKENEEQEEQNELLKLQADLASARNRKIRIFKEGEGFVYERDTEAIKEATDALKEYQKEADTSARTKPWRDILDMMDAMDVEANIKSLENKIGATTEELFGKMGTSLVDWTNWVSQNLSTTIGLDSILGKLETLTTYEDAVKALGEDLKVTNEMIDKAIEKSTVILPVNESTQGTVSQTGTTSETKSSSTSKKDSPATTGTGTTKEKAVGGSATTATSIATKETIQSLLSSTGISKVTSSPAVLGTKITENKIASPAVMGTSVLTGVSINNVNLPNVKDGEQFVTELKSIALQASTKRS